MEPQSVDIFYCIFVVSWDPRIWDYALYLLSSRPCSGGSYYEITQTSQKQVLVYFTNHKIYHSRLGSSQCTSHSSDVLEQQCSIIQRTVCPPWRFKHSSLTKLYKSWDFCSYWKILCGRGVGGSGLEDASYVLEQSSVLCIKTSWFKILLSKKIKTVLNNSIFRCASISRLYPCERVSE